ncbi:MAG: DUF3109 family protein [Porphyromonadaceae bacterium]|nr:DUF3109 family protein [Porphyromonadaceae bacterium]
MIEIGDKIVSRDIFEVMFACDYAVCKGICCVEGDSGAPVTPNEVDLLERHLPKVRHLLSPQALKVLDEQGVSYVDEEGDLVTSIVNGKDCAFTTYDDEGNCLCAYEKMYYAGEIDWIKPLSCQLYPIRLTHYPSFTAVNYHKWSVCRAALKKGKREGLPIYKFLERPLRYAFGDEWYVELEEAARLLQEEEL